MFVAPVDDVPIVLEVELPVVLAVLVFDAPLGVAALFWAVFIVLDELVLLPLSLFAALLAAELGAGLELLAELLESVLVCA